MRSDNFTLMRLAFACMVIYSHSYAVLGQPEPVFLGRSLGTFAVDSFFALSGYLVCGSFLNTSRSSFVLRRFMRIAPALFVFYQLALIAWRYCDGYPHNPTPYVNSPVWTIAWEIILYCLLFLIGITGMLDRFVIGSVYLSATVLSFVIFDPNSTTQTVVGQMFMLFTAGSLIKLVEAEIDMRLCGMIAIAVLVVLYVPQLAMSVAYLKDHIPFSFGPPFPFEHLRWMTSIVCLPYALIAIARYSPFSILIKSDYSYGVYLSAWPIQQVTVHTALASHPLTVFLISVCLSLLAAAMSWHFLEKYAIQLSHRSSRS